MLRCQRFHCEVRNDTSYGARHCRKCDNPTEVAVVQAPITTTVIDDQTEETDNSLGINKSTNRTFEIMERGAKKGNERYCNTIYQVPGIQLNSKVKI